MERKPIEEMTRYDEITEFGIVSAPIIALHCDWHNEDKKRDVFRAVRAYADRQNEDLLKELATLRPRPMSEMKDEHRDGRWLMFIARDEEDLVRYDANKKYWYRKNVDDSYWEEAREDEFTHFMLVPKVQK